MIKAIAIATPLNAALWYLIFSYPLYAVPVACAAAALLFSGRGGE